jgi:hypothetical protein
MALPQETPVKPMPATIYDLAREVGERTADILYSTRGLEDTVMSIHALHDFAMTIANNDPTLTGPMMA